ncbi:MAG: DegT/DnrJ/EryC1/StrS family aminotransferase [Nanoarchaeota archaeon]|nr:DegT/DnrJ/EryC1/StrS family aminotransferase [Nanoarchaeota archaeon]
MEDKVKKLLKNITGKTHIIFVNKGNTAIKEIIRLAKNLGKTKVLMQDQGGWITYKQFASKSGMIAIELKTDYGIINPEDLEKKADQNSVLLVNSLVGYYAEENMNNIMKICKKNNCLVINDISGSIGAKNCTYGDIVFASFGQWKPINLGFGGFIGFGEHLPLNIEMIPGTKKLLRRFISTPEYFKEFIEFEFKENDLKKLYEKINNLNKRVKFLKNRHWKIKKDLKNSDIIHRKKSGINVIVKYNNEEEKNKILKYCTDNHLEYTECPRYIRVNTSAISIEVKRL